MWDLTGKTVLVVGGGQAAYQKVRALVPFQVPVAVVAPGFSPDLEALAVDHPSQIHLHVKPFGETDLGDSALGLVYACTNDLDLNLRIVGLCRSRSLAVCDASQPGRGDFISPASFTSGPMVVSVSSGGTDLKGALALRDRLRNDILGPGKPQE